jgi:glycosyltransferase involved in cell wall biosynthesis
MGSALTVEGASAERVVAPARPLRVEHVLPSLKTAGMEVLVANLALALKARGHDVRITCLVEDSDMADRVRAGGVPVRVVRTEGALASVRPAAALTQHFRVEAPDIVHAHSGSWGKAVLAARAAGVPARVFTSHGLNGPESWSDVLFQRWAARHTEAVLVVSPWLHEHARRVAWVSPERIRLVTNGVDTRRFRPGPRGCTLHRRLGLAPDRRLVGTVARLAPIKNQALLVSAFARIASRHPDVDLVFVGEGEMEGALRAQAAEARIAERVHFAGVAQDTAPVFRDLDVFVLCSFSEGTPVSVIEAMATGTPVVATAVGECRTCSTRADAARSCPRATRTPSRTPSPRRWQGATAYASRLRRRAAGSRRSSAQTP